MAELKQLGDTNYGDQAIVKGDQVQLLANEEIDPANMEDHQGSDSESSESAVDAFKEAFLETQRKLVDLESELKSARQFIVELEEACASSEQKIRDLKAAPIRDLSIADGEGTVPFEGYSAVLESLEAERKQAEIFRARAARLENKLDEAAYEISRLLSQLDGDTQAESSEAREGVRDSAAELHEEVAAMKDDCARYLSRIARLTEENEAMRKEKSLNEALLREVKTLKDECDDIENENEQLEQEKRSLREELGLLEEKLASLESSQVQRERCVDKAVDSTQHKLADAETCLEQLRQQVIDHNEQARELEENCDQSRARNIELEKELSVLHIRIQDLEISMDDERQQSHVLRMEMKTKSEEQDRWRAKLDKEMRDAGREKDFLRLQLSDCKSKAETEARNLTKQLNEAQVRGEIFMKEVTEKERELQACRRDAERSDSEFSSLENQLALAHDAIARLQEANKLLEEECLSLTAGPGAGKTSPPQGMKTRRSPPPLAQGDPDLSDPEEEVLVQKLAQEVHAAAFGGADGELGAELRRVSEEKDCLAQKLADVEEKAEQTASELAKTIQSLNDRCEGLSQELADKEEVESEKANQLEQQVRRLREENEQLQKELEKVGSDVELASGTDEKYDSLKKSYDELLHESEKLEEEHEKIMEEKDALLEEIEEWQNDFEAKKQKYLVLSNENDTLKDEKQTLENQVQRLQEDLAKKGDARGTEVESQLKSQREKVAERLKRLKEEAPGSDESFEKEDKGVGEWREMYSTLRTRVDQLERGKNSIERDRDRLARKCNNLEDEVEEVRSKYSRMRREVSDAHGEVSNLRQMLSELRAAKETAERQLKIQEDKSEKHMKELENITWNLSPGSSDGGMVLRYESLKLKLDEVEAEKETLRNKTNNLQYKLHSEEEKAAENQVKLNEAHEEKQRLEKELEQSKVAGTELEVLLKKISQEKEQDERQCQWYKDEMAKKEASLTDLEQKLRNLQIELKIDNEKSGDGIEETKRLQGRVAFLEEEVRRLNEGAGDKKDEVDSGYLRTRVRELETSLEALKVDLESKNCELENVEREKESLSLHTVELKREIQCLYERFEATKAKVAELQNLPQAVALAPLEVAQASDVHSAPPTESEKVEKTEMTIEVEPKSDAESDGPRERIAGLERKVSIVNIPISATPKKGSAGSVTEEPEVPITLRSSTPTVLQSTPEDDAVFPPPPPPPIPPPPEEELVAPVEHAQAFACAPLTADKQRMPLPTPERIRVSAQALPLPQVPRSVDTRRYPFSIEGAVRVGSGAFRPVPVQSRVIPDERRRAFDYEIRDGGYLPEMFRYGRHQRSRSEPGDLGRLRDLEDEALFSSTPENQEREQQVRQGALKLRPHEHVFTLKSFLDKFYLLV